LSRSKILVVDDDPSIRKFVQANLEARGYEVLTASDGEDAIKVAEK
jgi:DNA-binding response OmpR family regulator